MSDQPRQYHLCPLCGYEFEKAGTECASSCPLGKFCKLIRCPSCQYEFPAQRERTGWLHSLFHRKDRRPGKDGALSLTDLEEGETAELICLNSEHASRRNALAVYGMVPGCRLVLLQKRPSYVVRVGETELALEEPIAKEVSVKRLAPCRTGDVNPAASPDAPCPTKK